LIAVSVGKAPRGVGFDGIFEHLEGAAEAAGLGCVRADFEPYGGFTHPHMYERFLLADYVIADLTVGNPNVSYLVGLRQGARAGNTLLVCEEASIDALAFDLRPYPILPYRLEQDGSLTSDAAQAFSRTVAKHLRQVSLQDVPSENPLLQITGWTTREDVAHSKTDIFLDRMRFASDVGRQVAVALASGGEVEKLARLRDIEDACVAESGSVVVQLHTALMSLYIGYREAKGFADMVRLFGRMPPELQRKAVTQEQLALALNRIAEEDEQRNERGKAAATRQRALAALDAIPETARTSETCGIRGRIHKGWSDAERRAGNLDQADAQLERAIAVYDEGFRLDPRDYYPGVNAITLRLRRGRREDMAGVDALTPVVRFAVDRAPAPKDETERYWQYATRLELAATAKDWERADELLTDLLGIDAQPWMHETTAANLAILRDGFSTNPDAQQRLDGAIQALQRI
jgi:tetratricopeptide (TPR) repeat protein